MPTKQKDNLETLFTLKIRALYDIETQLVKALPKMAKKAFDPELKDDFTNHLTETEEHVARLERIFDFLEIAPKKLQCDGIRGLIADANWVIQNVKGSEALDASLIAAAEYVEHYETAGYQSAIEWAKLLGKNDAADLLKKTLDEEQAAATTLEELAKSRINETAKY